MRIEEKKTVTRKCKKPLERSRVVTKKRMRQQKKKKRSGEDERQEEKQRVPHRMRRIS